MAEAMAKRKAKAKKPKRRKLGRDAQEKDYGERSYENDFVGYGIRRRHLAQLERIQNQE